MKIILKYQEPKTNIDAYKFCEVFDETEIDDAREELEAVRNAGYEVTRWSIVHDEDVYKVLNLKEDAHGIL